MALEGEARVKQARAEGSASRAATQRSLRTLLKDSAERPDWLRVWQRLSHAPSSSTRPRRRRPDSSRRAWLRWAVVGFAVGTGGAALFTLASADGAALEAWLGERWAALRGAVGELARPPLTSAPLALSPSAPSAEATPARSLLPRGVDARALAIDPERTLVATARQTYVYAEPSFDARRLGYLRAGQSIARAQEPAGFDGC